jgi:3-oxoacyl-[acyl-carrier-protein] synthase II
MVLGSGAAALVLEDMESARRRGATIHGEYLGGGFTSDGWKVTMPDAVHGRYSGAIASALRASGIGAREVTTIVPHGLGTGLFDRFEASSLAAIFGGHGADWPAVMALKGALGHTLGGCVLVETAASLLAMRRGEIPAHVRCEQTDPELGMGRPRREAPGREWTLLKCTNGFAGQNGAIVLRSVS